jgi:ElaB/YqjD/DUF883 family membrane-anchored ribosome-binding protein
MDSDGGSGIGAEGRASARDIAQGMQDRIEGMRGYAEDAGEWLRTLAREKPLAAIALAAGAGFIVGRFLSRT